MISIRGIYPPPLVASRRPLHWVGGGEWSPRNGKDVAQEREYGRFMGTGWDKRLMIYGNNRHRITIKKRYGLLMTQASELSYSGKAGEEADEG